MTTGEKNIIIVGGGIIGSCTAYFLTRHPLFNPSLHKVTLLESTKIAGGASGKAGGLLALWAYPKEIVPLSYRTHKELADRHDGANRWGYRAVTCGQIEAKGRSVSTATVKGKSGDAATGEPEAVNGASRVSLQKRSAAALSHLRAAGVPDDLDWVEADALRAYDSMSGPEASAQVHPYQFTTAMAELAADGGADVRTNAHVESLTYGADGNSVVGVTYLDRSTGQQHKLDATDVIVAAGPWTKTVFPAAPIGALRAHSVVIKPTRPVSPYCLFTSISLPPGFGGAKRGQIVTPEIYARQTEVYACGEGDRLVPLPPSSAEVKVDERRCQDVLDYVASVSEELRDGEVTARQACYLPEVITGGDPMVGPTGTEGLWLAAGHTCWGIQNGPGSGKVMAEWVMEGKPTSIKGKGLDPRREL